MITIVIFDLSEVYMHGLLGVEKRIEKRLGVPIKNSDLHIPEIEQLFLGKIEEEVYLQALIDKYDWQITIKELKKNVRSNFREIKGTRKIVESLKRNGYRLGLLSVHAKEWVEHCEKEFEYHKLFDSSMYSFEVGVCKPKKKAFKLMLDKLNAASNECLFIDDLSQNTEAAKKLGIEVLNFTTPAKLRSDLTKLNIKVD